MSAAGTALLLACSVGPASAQQDCKSLDPAVQALLEAMSDQAQQISYSGVVTLQRGSDMQIMELSHNVANGQMSEQMGRLTGQDARVLRDGHPADCTHPGHRILRAELAPGSESCGLAGIYRFSVSDGDRIAGREALRLRAEPRDMYRFGYVFELDRDTALVLKSTTIAADQRVLEQFQFASLQLVPGSSGEAAVEHRTHHPHPNQSVQREESAARREGPGWDIAWLPRGFTATDAAAAGAQRKSFTDGLATFSVFLEPLNVAIKPGEGVERQGSTVAYTRGVILQRRPALVTVLGEIPTNTARMVADSVRLR